MNCSPLCGVRRITDHLVRRAGELDDTYGNPRMTWLYLADVHDLGSHRVVSYALDERLPAEIVVLALEMAVDIR